MCVSTLNKYSREGEGKTSRSYLRVLQHRVVCVCTGVPEREEEVMWL